MTRPPFEAPAESDIAEVSRQLGRPARDVVGIAARCVCGAPTVVSTRPRLADGTPFPTFYYLTHPAATAAVSTLEAEGRMPALAALLEGDVASAYRAAHEQYLADRAHYGDVPEIDGISAGGMPDRVKCLHALVGHALAAGPGVNPIGDLALAESSWSPDICQCAAPLMPVEPPDAPAVMLVEPVETSDAPAVMLVEPVETSDAPAVMLVEPVETPTPSGAAP
jgi:hypothetical protein